MSRDSVSNEDTQRRSHPGTAPVRPGGRWLVIVAATAILATTLATVAEGQQAGTWAFTSRDHKAGSRPLLDLRYLNEKEAGQSGFVRLTEDGNGFALGDGTPARFWAVGTDIFKKTPEEIARHTRFLARIGVNLVRIHAQIASKEKGSRVTDVDEKVIDGIWRFVASAKSQGIYTIISPYWAMNWNAGGWGIEGYTGTTDLWGLLFFDETLQSGYKAWARALYARKNPYTGIPLARDRAVALIQIQNEDSLLFWTLQGLKPVQQERLGKKFGAWLTAKYGSLDKAKQSWGGVRHDKDDFASGRVGLYSIWPMTQPQAGGMARRVSDELEFYARTQRAFYESMAAFYRKDLGCRHLINASNWKTADPIRLDDVERWTYEAADVIAVNRYYGGSHLGDQSGWRIDPGHHFTQQSVLLDPRGLPTNLKQVVGHPMIVTESSWISPMTYQSEGPFLMACYQSLTGIDAVCWYVATSPEFEVDPSLNFLNIGGQHPLYKWSASIPMIMGGFPAAALMHRRGFIKQGEPVVHEERTLRGLWDRDVPIIAEGPTFDPNRDRGLTTGGQPTPKASVDPLAFLVGPVEVKYGGDPAKTKTFDLSRFIDHEKRVVKSITGEIALDSDSGFCILNTPKAQGACGFLSKAGDVLLSDVSIRSKNNYGSVAVVSMDDRPLASSGRILVQVGTTARLSGWQDRAAEFKGEDGKTTLRGLEVVKTGTAPWRVANTEVGLSVRNPGLKKGTLLDVMGYPVREVEGVRAGTGFSLVLPPSTMYLILE